MKILYLIVCIVSILQAAKIEIKKINQRNFDKMVYECKELSISSRCYFVGMQVLYPELNALIYDGVKMNFKHNISTQEGLKMLQKACYYDKAQKIKAIKTKKYIDYINADAMACYTLFIMHENISDGSAYHKTYIKAMQPYLAGYDNVDIYDSLHNTNIVSKDLKVALGYYKHMCYEPTLQIQCAKYQGLVNKLQDLCKKGHKNACIY